jgi:hypothetical protein
MNHARPLASLHTSLHASLHASLRASLLASLLACLLASCIDPANDDALSQGTSGCPTGTKRCGGQCVSRASAATGCGAEACEACAAAPHTNAVCVAEACAVGGCEAGFGDCDGKSVNGCEADLLSDGKHCGGCAVSCQRPGTVASCELGVCKVVRCEEGWGDCNGEGADGCEAELGSSSSHCGACGVACAKGEVCASGACVFDPDTTKWLASQQGGFCDDVYNRFVNLCGDVGSCTKFNVCTDDIGGPKGECWVDDGHLYPQTETWPGGVPFCCNPTIMKVYPDGLSIDVGFHYDGQSTGLLFDVGGDCDLKRASMNFFEPGMLWATAGQGADKTPFPVSAGAHLVSLRATVASQQVYLDGVLVAEGKGPSKPVELTPDCGAGFVLGQRLAFWSEEQYAGNWLRVEPFLVHLREGVDSEPWSLSEAVQPSARSIVLFEPSGAKGSRWTSKVGGITAVAVDAHAPAQPPVWVDDVGKQCF